MDDIELKEQIKTAYHTWRTLTPAEWKIMTDKANDGSWEEHRLSCYPDCPLCHGEGSFRAPAIPGEEGYTRFMICPNSYQVRIREDAKRYGLVISEIDGLDWSIIKNINNAWKARDAVQQVIQDCYGWIFLWGDHGQAKTLLLKIAIACCLRNRIEAAYTNMVGILDNLKRAFDLKPGENPEAENKLEFWQ